MVKAKEVVPDSFFVEQLLDQAKQFSSKNEFLIA